MGRTALPGEKPEKPCFPSSSPSAFRRLFAVFSKLALGLMLVGCSTMPGLRLNQSRTDSSTEAVKTSSDSTSASASNWLKNPFKKRKSPILSLSFNRASKGRIAFKPIEISASPNWYPRKCEPWHENFSLMEPIPNIAS